MSKRTMKKFRISLDLDACDLYVWGEDEDDVDDVLSELDISELVESFDASFSVEVVEDPEVEDEHITDGVITSDRGWINATDFKDEDGNLIVPTSKEVPQESDEPTQAELEAAGQLRLFVDPPESGDTLTTGFPEPAEVLSTDE
jgi:hypothetical protein